MSKRRLRRKLRAWGRRQMYSFFSSLGNLLSHRLGTLMTTLVIGVAMMLPLGLYLTVQSIQVLDLSQDQWGTVSVFMDADAEIAAVEKLADEINDSAIGTVAEKVSPERGMEMFRDRSGFGDVIDVLEENPLPWVILVKPVIQASEVPAQAIASLTAWLQAQPGVALVQVDHKWLERLSGLLQLAGAIVSVLTMLFSLAVVVIVANTIRMDVVARKQEIEVLSLVGAGSGFIRQPFLYSGFWYGLLGAALALLLMSLAFMYLDGPLQGLLAAYGSSHEMHTLGWAKSLLVLVAGGLLGLLGAWLSVHHHLRSLRSV